MSGLLRRAAGFFVAPGEQGAGAPHGAGSDSAPSAAVGLGLAVLCGPRDTVVVGAAVGLLLARSRRARCVVVAEWTGRPSGPRAGDFLSTRAARRLGASLAARDLEVCVRGRVVRVLLPVDEASAAAAARRALAAAGGAPSVLVLGGPRDRAFEPLLLEQDHVVVATAPDTDPEVVALATSGLPDQLGSVGACQPACTIPARALARAGLLATPALRAALGPALRTLP